MGLIEEPIPDNYIKKISKAEEKGIGEGGSLEDEGMNKLFYILRSNTKDVINDIDKSSS